MKYAKLVIENKSRHTDRLYTYRCADNTRIGQVDKGSPSAREIPKGEVLSLI